MLKKGSAHIKPIGNRGDPVLASPPPSASSLSASAPSSSSSAPASTQKKTMPTTKPPNPSSQKSSSSSSSSSTSTSISIPMPKSQPSKKPTAPPAASQPSSKKKPKMMSLQEIVHDSPQEEEEEVSEADDQEAEEEEEEEEEEVHSRPTRSTFSRASFDSLNTPSKSKDWTLAQSIVLGVALGSILFWFFLWGCTNFEAIVSFSPRLSHPPSLIRTSTDAAMAKFYKQRSSVHVVGGEDIDAQSLMVEDKEQQLATTSATNEKASTPAPASPPPPPPPTDRFVCTWSDAKSADKNTFLDPTHICPLCAQPEIVKVPGCESGNLSPIWAFSSSVLGPPPDPKPTTLVPAKYTPPDYLEGRKLPITEGAKGIIVVMVSAAKFGFLQGFIENIDKHFLSQQKGVPILLVYERYPNDLTNNMYDFVEGNHWQRIDNPAQTWRRGNKSLQNGRFRLGSGSEVWIRGIWMNAPHYLETDPLIYDAPDWTSCAGRHHLWHEMFYAPFHSFQMIVHEWDELREFDYVGKVDLRVRFTTAPSMQLFPTMGSKGCSFAHVGVRESNSDCTHGTFEALQAYNQEYGVSALSANQKWCSSTSPAHYWDSNMYFVSQRWIQSKEMKHLARWMYENEQWSGYFKKGWGDAAVWPKFMCEFFEMDNMKQNQHVCDFTDLEQNFKLEG